MEERPSQGSGGEPTPPEASRSPNAGEEGKPARPRRRRDRSRPRRGRRAAKGETSPVSEGVPARTESRKAAEPRPAPERKRRPDDAQRTRRGRPSAPRSEGAEASTVPEQAQVPRLTSGQRPTSRQRPSRPTTGTHARPSASASPGRAFWIAVVALTIVAVLVRLPGLGSGLWADEIYSALQSFRTPFPETLSVFPGDNKHPLYALLAHASLTLFGESAWSIRLPALAFGVATVPMLYVLGSRITSRVESFAAAAVLALSYHHVWFSQNARGYTALAFAAVLATWQLLRAMRTEGYRSWIVYGVVAGLGVYTHLTFVFTVVAQFMVVGLATLGWPSRERRVHWSGPLAGFGVALAVALALYLPMASQVVAFFLHKESNLRGISSPAWALGEAIRVLRVGFGGALGVGLGVLVLGAVVGIAGAVSYAKQGMRTFLLLVLPAVVTLVGAFAARGTMYPRFFFMLAGFALLIGMRGVFVTGSWVARRFRWSESTGYALGSSLAGMVALVSGLSLPLDWQAPKQDFEGAAAYAEQSASGTDRIVTVDVTSSIYGMYYRKAWQAIRTTDELDQLRHDDASSGEAGRRVWLIYTFPRYLERFDAGLASYVRRECGDANVRRFRGTVGDGDLLVCRLDRA